MTDPRPIKAHELSDGARVSTYWLGVRRLPGERDTVDAYRVTFYSPGGALIFTDSTLTLPYRDDARALADGVGFLAAYADETSGAGRYLSELAPWADELGMVAGELDDARE